MPVPATDMDSVPNGAVESSAESPAAEASLEAKAKGRGLRRWRRLPREHHQEGPAAGVAVVGGAAADDAAQLHKRRLPLAADARKEKHEASVQEESSTASVESRFIPLQPVPMKLDPDLGLLIASAGFSVGAGGADSDNSEDRSSKSSTAASAPRHDFSPSARSRAPGATLHGKNPRAARARADRPRAYTACSPAKAENSRSSMESDLRSSSSVNIQQQGVGVFSNGIHRVISDGDDRSDEEQASEELRSTAGGYCKENGSSVVGRLVRQNGNSDDDDDGVDDAVDQGGSVGKGENGTGMHSVADSYAESILSLQRVQEALENEVGKFGVLWKESSDGLSVDHDEWCGSVHLEEPVEEASERIKDLESRLEEASALIMEKDSRILELEALTRTRAWRSAIQTTNMLLLEPDLEQLFQEKMEAEIQCIILARASQTGAPLSMDQLGLYEEQKSLFGDYKQLGLKLRSAENRAMMLEEMTMKLEAQCKELSMSSEILQLQSKASRVSLFCFIQFILLCFAVGTFLIRLLPSSTELAPT